MKALKDSLNFRLVSGEHDVEALGLAPVLPEAIEIGRNMDRVACGSAGDPAVHPDAAHIVSGSQTAVALWMSLDERAFPLSLLPTLSRLLTLTLSLLRGRCLCWPCSLLPSPPRGAAPFVCRLAFQDLYRNKELLSCTLRQATHLAGQSFQIRLVVRKYCHPAPRLQRAVHLSEEVSRQEMEVALGGALSRMVRGLGEVDAEVCDRLVRYVLPENLEGVTPEVRQVADAGAY